MENYDSKPKKKESHCTREACVMSLVYIYSFAIIGSTTNFLLLL